MDSTRSEGLAARCRLYDLLARLVLRPPDRAQLDALRLLPGFAEQIAADPDAIEVLQVEHELIFGRNVYPYESLFLDRDLMLNTAAADRVAQLYTACGFSPDPRAAGAPDHLGLELGLMAHLLGLEIAALDRQDATARAAAHAWQGRCLHTHLALWAPGCLSAVERVATHPLYLLTAQLALELVLDDLGRVAAPLPEALPRKEHKTVPTPTAMWAPEAEQIPLRPKLEQPESEEEGLNRVVIRLITPDEVGLFLSRSDLSAIGRQLELPVPIGERFQMLRGLFESAGQFDLVAPLLGTLDTLLASEMARIGALASAHPAWGAGAQHWRARLSRGRALLEELRAQLPAILK